ncbi:MAG: hypothetical protein CMJ18_20125 [Phycisphaeraceae bacterium]|nr:hypothetical protein [Phycisphaeraceae bacterium]
MEPKFYELVPWRLSLRDYLSGSSVLLAPIILVFYLFIRIFRLRINTSGDEIAVHALSPFETTPDEFDDPVREFFDESALALEDLGFEPVAWYRINDAATSTAYHLSLHRHADGSAFGIVKHRTWYFVRPNRKYRSITFVTPTTGSSFLVTTSAKPDSLLPDDLDIERMTRAKAPALWARHQQRLSGQSVRTLSTSDATIEQLERMHAVARDFHVERGAFKEPGADAAEEASDLPAPYDQSPNAPILGELLRLEQRRWGWLTGVLVVGVTIAVFLGAGAMAWTWQFAGMLVLILLVHEMGHFVAMKAFGYRDVRMFFIPMLGAAVSGRPTNVAGWKKVIVYLAGPLPGIAIGIAAGIGAIVNGQEWLQQLALIAIVLNLINLAPILPLDGGRVIDTTLTSRHPMADVAFRIVTVSVLALGWLATQDGVLLGLGILMGVGLPGSYKLARITNELRGKLPPADEHDDRPIPLAAADAIATKVQEQFTRATTAKTSAQLVRQCHDRLTEQPPSILATFGLLSVHGGSVFVALIACMVFVIASLDESGAFLDLATRQPAHKYDAQDVQTAGAMDAGQHGGGEGRVTLVATFEDVDDARTFWSSLTADLAGDVQALRAGPLIVIELPEDSPGRPAIVDAVEAKTEYVTVTETRLGTPFNVSFVAPTMEAAQRIEGDVNGAVTMGHTRALVPPWHPTVSITAEQALARATYHRLINQDDQEPEAWAEEHTRLLEQLTAATRRGQKDRVEAVQKQLEEAGAARKARHIERIRAEGPEGAHFAMVDLYTRQPQYDWTEDEAAEQAYQKDFQRWLEEVVEHLGPAPADPHLGLAVRGGFVERAGLAVRFTSIVFERPVMGLPVLLEWLSDREAVSLRFESVHPPSWIGDVFDVEEDAQVQEREEQEQAEQDRQE